MTLLSLLFSSALSLVFAASPVCSTNGQGWVSAEGKPVLYLQEQCTCFAQCRNVGTPQEGWYSSCTSSLITAEECGEEEALYCTQEAKLCPDGKTFVGRDPKNNCQFAACPVPPPNCQRYVCADGVEAPRCADDGTEITYMEPPCTAHGGDLEPEASSSGGPFSDVPLSHEHAEAIAYMKAEGIVQGYPDGTYRPGDNINRAEFTKILAGVEWLSIPEETRALMGISLCDTLETVGDDIAESRLFPDVPKDAWFASPICHMKGGAIQGYPDGTFGPDRYINFAESAKIIVKVMSAYEMCGDAPCPLVGVDHPWFEQFVRGLESYDAIPMSVDSFEHLTTRGEMAEMIWRLHAGINTKETQTYDALLQAQ